MGWEMEFTKLIDIARDEASVEEFLRVLTLS